VGNDPAGYLAGLKIGYIAESFEDLEDETAKANAMATLEVKAFQSLAQQALS
jgi:hypothetical protein